MEGEQTASGFGEPASGFPALSAPHFVISLFFYEALSQNLQTLKVLFLAERDMGCHLVIVELFWFLIKIKFNKAKHLGPLAPWPQQSQAMLQAYV